MSQIQDNYILWKGSWRSSIFDDVYGTIKVALMKDIHNNNDYITKVVVEFGVWDQGKKVIIPVSINVNNIKLLNDKVVKYLEFRTVVGGCEIDYYISVCNKDIISGIYKTSNDDGGIIELEPSTDRIIDYNDQNNKTNSWCVIC